MHRLPLCLKSTGVEPVPNEQAVIRISGVSSGTNWDYFKQRYGFEVTNKDLDKRKQEIHVAWLRKKVTAMPGLLPLLQMLRSHEFKIAIASSSSREHINVVTDKLGVTDFFDVIVSGDEVTRGKPAPDIFLRAADELGIAPSVRVVLEDASNGVQAAEAAGIRVIAVPNIFTTKEDFSMADLVVDSLQVIDMATLKRL
jgi:HAD superfamily hydrolase (TIGR01509 family)